MEATSRTWHEGLIKTPYGEKKTFEKSKRYVNISLFNAHKPN